MTRSPRLRKPKLPARAETCGGAEALPTVASTGVQVHLVPADLDRERQLESLITACESLRAEWERLFQRLIDLLNEDGRGMRNRHRSPPSLGRHGGSDGVG